MISNQCPLVVGQYGWKPNPYVTDYEVWHYYDIPLAGSFCWNNGWYVFEATDAMEDDQDWLYYPVMKSELDTMPKTFAEAADFHEWFNNFVDGRPHWVVHTKTDKITGWGEAK